MFKSLSDSFKKRFSGKDELSRHLQIVKVFEMYLEVVQKKINITQGVKPISLQNRILTIQAESSVIASELRFVEKDVIEKINHDFKEEVVKKVRYRF